MNERFSKICSDASNGTQFTSSTGFLEQVQTRNDRHTLMKGTEAWYQTDATVESHRGLRQI